MSKRTWLMLMLLAGTGATGLMQRSWAVQPIADLEIMIINNSPAPPVDVQLTWSRPQGVDSFNVYSGEQVDYLTALSTWVAATADTSIILVNALLTSPSQFYQVRSSSYVPLDPVPLGAAMDFTVLAGSTVTNTGGSVVTGDLGVSPGSEVTGFPPGVVIGAIHSADVAAALAQLDLTVAYNDAAGRTTAPILVDGNLGGMTLPPGLYKCNTAIEISSGDLTLDAQGDENAVWIFQIATTLITTSGRQVLMAGGAQARYVYWQVGSSATLGTGSIFKGIIMADQTITLNTGAVLEGRALARIAAVNLDTNPVTAPLR